MTRSQIDALIEDAVTMLHDRGIRLPPFAYWTEADWRTKGAECDAIRDCRLGWDVTDFGSGAFERTGLVAFTLRNGHPTLERYLGTTYSEKILIVRENQRTPMHYHARKQEDIICRAGGNLVCQVYSRGNSGGLGRDDLSLLLDGVERRVPSGYAFVIRPGESIRLPAFVFHEFYAEGGTGTAIVGEVATVNDDIADNFFLDPRPRFTAIEEDAPPVYLLCTDHGHNLDVE